MVCRNNEGPVVTEKKALYGELREEDYYIKYKKLARHLEMSISKKAISKTNKRISNGNSFERRSKSNASNPCHSLLANSSSPLTIRQESLGLQPAPTMSLVSSPLLTANCSNLHPLSRYIDIRMRSSTFYLQRLIHQ